MPDLTIEKIKKLLDKGFESESEADIREIVGWLLKEIEEYQRKGEIRHRLSMLRDPPEGSMGYALKKERDRRARGEFQ